MVDSKFTKRDYRAFPNDASKKCSACELTVEKQLDEAKLMAANHCRFAQNIPSYANFIPCSRELIPCSDS
jgi:hypothetical protein